MSQSDFAKGSASAWVTEWEDLAAPLLTGSRKINFTAFGFGVSSISLIFGICSVPDTLQFVMDFIIAISWCFRRLASTVSLGPSLRNLSVLCVSAVILLNAHKPQRPRGR